jgi:hypothetical protein
VPSILVVAADGARRAALVDALARRFRADYDVIARSTGDDVGPELGPLAVALAPIGTDDFTMLQRIDAAHPGAKRIAVVEVGDRSVADELAKAMTLGQVGPRTGVAAGLSLTCTANAPVATMSSSGAAMTPSP